MIQLKIQTEFGEIVISGDDASELKTHASQLENSTELFASVGRVRGNFGDIGQSSSAISNVGEILGGQVVEAETEPENSHDYAAMGYQMASVWNPEMNRMQEAWYGPGEAHLPATDNPHDPGLTNGTKRFWKWI